jgi:hypothetical protein
MTQRFPFLAYASPRKLPKAKDVPGRVVVLDIAFAAGTGGASFVKTTKPFIDGLGARLARWVDHHDHVLHAEYAHDPRFVLATKAEHGACPEMVTPALVADTGLIDSIVCHTDFDGLCCAAKWIRGGVEPYAGADADAHAIDTRLGTASERAAVIDRAIRARPREDGLRGLIVRFLAGGAEDGGLWADLRKIADEVRALEDEARQLARKYVVEHGLAVVDTRGLAGSSYDKTLLLMLGQERARISVVHDDASVTAAARFDSGVDLLALLGIEGGMPTRVSVAASRLDEVLGKLRGA